MLSPAGTYGELLLIGRTIGPYRVLRHLGSGGMGDVFLAEDSRLGRQVAIKRLADRWLDSQDAQDRLSREACAAARLNHPNIAAIYDVIQVDDRPHIVMEYVEGETLSALVGRGPLPPAQVVAVAQQLTEALAAAHALGIVHRDLKPANIWLTRDGRVKVLDFGIARMRDLARSGDGSAEEPPQSQSMGTPGYMAPEQLLGNPADHRSDIYSLGAVMFELLTGRPPFDGPDPMARALAAMSASPPAVRDISAAVPAALDALVTRALARAPGNRFPSVHEMRHELSRIAGCFPAARTLPPDAPTVAVPPVIVPSRSDSGGWAMRQWTASRSRRQWIAALVAICLMVVAVLPLARRWTTPTAATGLPIVIVLPLSNASGDPANDHIGLGFADSLIARLAGVPSVAVVSRGASAEYAGRADTHDRIVRALGATYLVDGSYQQVGPRLLVNVRLVEAGTSVVRGSWTLEAEFEQLFDLQRHMALAVSEQMRLTLTAAERRRLETPPTRDLQAYFEYSEARVLMQRHDIAGNTDEAIAKLQRAIARDDSFALAHAALGDAYWLRFEAVHEQRWADRAIEAIDRAARLDPDDGEVRVSLARVYGRTGKLDEALGQLNVVLERQPGNDAAWRELGTVLEAAGRPTEALDAFERAIARGPGFWRNYLALGNFHFRRARYAEAAVAYEQAIEAAPDNVWLFENIGAAYQAAGDEPRALANFERAIQLSPDADGAHANLGRLHYMAGRFAEAASAYERAIAIVPRDPLYHRNAGGAYARLGELDRAHAAFRRAIQIAEELLAVNPHDGGLLALQAVCEANIGQHETAERRARAAREIAPADPYVQYRAAVAYAIAGRADEALDALEQALAHGFDPALARQDDDLQMLMIYPRFAELVGGRR
jgi:eukaryotic-like serine/threonine-protein kinase